MVLLIDFNPFVTYHSRFQHNYQSLYCFVHLYGIHVLPAYAHLSIHLRTQYDSSRSLHLSSFCSPFGYNSTSKDRMSMEIGWFTGDQFTIALFSCDIIWFLPSQCPSEASQASPSFRFYSSSKFIQSIIRQFLKFILHSHSSRRIFVYLIINMSFMIVELLVGTLIMME